MIDAASRLVRLTGTYGACRLLGHACSFAGLSLRCLVTT
jgi:hypothetical protein